MNKSMRWYAGLFAIVIGCAEVGPDADEVETRTSAVITNADFTDATGTILIRVKTCDYASSQQSGTIHNACAYCIMDSDWARVGGGAEIFDEVSPGAQLTVTRPDGFAGAPPPGCFGGGPTMPNVAYDVWIARSRGIVPHQLRAYAVGMKIRDVNGATIAPEITSPTDTAATNVSPPANASTVLDSQHIFEALGKPNQLVVAAGAEIVPNSANAYLTESAPVLANGVAWRASSRLLQANPDGSAVKAWAVGLDPCPPGWQGRCFTNPSIRQAIAAATGGYGTAIYTLPGSWVTPVAGGRAPSGGGGGRYLADLIPLAGSSRGTTVRSKAGAVGDTAQTYAFAVALGRDGAPYNWNSVRFNAGDGLTLYKQSGTDVVLQQAPTTGDVASKRWHLEHLGNGVYRLRNGNPDGGGQCAYRVGTTSVVRVNTCGTSNAFKWTGLSSNLGILYTGGGFQLKNSSSTNLCLDNNGVTASQTPTNLLLKTCAPGSNAQLLFLDTFNWPPP